MDRAIGAFFFLFIPVTLVLMLRMPFGQGRSLLGAAAIIAMHRAVASRWVFARAGKRCLYCGGAPRDPESVELASITPLSVCRGESERLDRFLGFVSRRAQVLRLGILGPVFGYFLLGALASVGIEPVSVDLRRTLFRVAVALSVMSVAIFHRFHPAARPEGFPFPIHNLALLGVRLTLAVFLVVGSFWLALEMRLAVL